MPLHLRRILGLLDRPGSSYLAWVVGVLGLVITAWMASSLHAYQRERLAQRFATEVERATQDVSQRLQQPLDGLKGVHGLFAASASVNTREFKNYWSVRPGGVELPGVLGVGYIERLSHRYQVQMFEPQERNQAALGSDFASDPTVKEAADWAARHGLPALTSSAVPILLDGALRQGLLLLEPIYQPGMPTDSEQGRLQALTGWAYSPLILEELLAPTVEGVLATDLRLQLLTGTPGKEPVLLLQVGWEENPSTRAPGWVRSVPLQIFGAPLYLRI